MVAFLSALSCVLSAATGCSKPLFLLAEELLGMQWTTPFLPNKRGLHEL